MSNFNSLTEKEKCNEIMYMVRGQLSSTFRNKEDAIEILNYIKEKLSSTYKINVDEPVKEFIKPVVREDTCKEKHKRKDEDTVNKVREMLNQGKSYSQIGRALNIDRRTVSRISNTKY